MSGRKLRGDSFIYRNTTSTSAFPPARIRALVLILCFLGIGVAMGSSVWSRPSNTWRIKFNKRAASSGELIFRVEPTDEELTEIQIEIEEGWKEEIVALVVRNGFQEQLPEELYHVQAKGETVLIRKRRGSSAFELHLGFSSVKDLQIKIKRGT